MWRSRLQVWLELCFPAVLLEAALLRRNLHTFNKNDRLLACQTFPFCEWSRFSQMAKQQSSWSSDSSRMQCCRCGRRWRGTKGWKWVRHVEEWSMRHAVSRLMRCAKGQHNSCEILSHTHVRVKAQGAQKCARH